LLNSLFVSRAALRRQRGQAIVETAIFLPILLTAMFALIFFSRLGVLSERGESAVRYGQLVTFRNGSYTVGAVYELIDELLNPSANYLGPLCLAPAPSAATPAPSNNVGSAVLAALTQSQVLGSSTGPAAKRFWQPDTTPATPPCLPFSISLTSSASSAGPAAANSPGLPLSITGVSISAQISAPPILTKVISNTTTSAQINFLNVAAPNVLLACLPGMSAVLTVLQPALTSSQLSGASSLCPSALP
jgi:hypothetical protein